METWYKLGRRVLDDDSVIILYANGEYGIESRKEPVMTMDGNGFWYKKSYILIYPDGREKEFPRMCDAKRAARVAQNG